MPAENIETPVKIGKFSASVTIVKESWNILKQDKEIMLFPIFSTICTLLSIALMGALFFMFALGGTLDASHLQEGGLLSEILKYAILLVYYVVTFFIVNFFEAGLFTIVQARFSGKDMTFSEGLDGAIKNSSKIFLWSLISATVGVILRITTDKFKFIGSLIAWLLGSAWNILTYFSLPALVIGGLSVKESFKESASIIRKTWGETIIVNFGVGFFFALLVFLLTALSIGIVVLVPSLIIFIVIFALYVTALIVLSVISSALSSVFKLALFTYARTGEVPQGFSSEIIKGAVRQK